LKPSCQKGSRKKFQKKWRKKNSSSCSVCCRGSGGPYGNSLMNKQMGKGAKEYGRKCLVFLLQENINAMDETARKKFKFKLLYEILVLTNKLNTKMNPGNRGNNYKICFEDDPAIHKHKSLDSYRKDHDSTKIVPHILKQQIHLVMLMSSLNSMIQMRRRKKMRKTMMHTCSMSNLLLCIYCMTSHLLVWIC
jgi:hypothetical protein